jgi:hypothetical protein
VFTYPSAVVSRASIAPSTYPLFAACNNSVGAPGRDKAPVIVSPAFATFVPTKSVRVPAKFASSPIAAASSFKVFSAPGAASMRAFTLD